MSSLLAGVALLSSLIILFLCLNSWDPNSVMHAFGLGQLSYGQIITVVYLKVSVSDFLTLFSARTPEGFFWTTAPSWILFGASVFALSLSTVVACAWPSSYPDGIYALGLGYRHPKSLALFVWVYCIFWWFVQDFLKVCLHKYMERYGIFGMIKNEQAHQLDARKNRNAKDKYTDKGSRMDVGAERNEDALEGIHIYVYIHIYLYV
jgi:H+-transporting ATPase